MIKIVLCCCLAALACGAPAGPDGSTTTPVPIISQSNVVNGDGSFQNSYESGDGTKVEASGELKTVGPDGEVGEAVKGSYSFSIDGVLYSLTYTADENGFQPQADFIPTTPPIPEKILEALAYNAAHPEEDTPAPKSK
ncbi:endocuticle structural glycoprotein SgAbd-3-like [Bacillus rossius redtenbacheri]|uniref:endocuticle structural glycoprotein SgAbd-3-like n=1 Tax=Bacillus rossius redtenbacheri TaxID=93214 RepID=UPI002FDD1911